MYYFIAVYISINKYYCNKMKSRLRKSKELDLKRDKKIIVCLGFKRFPSLEEFSTTTKNVTDNH